MNREGSSRNLYCLLGLPFDAVTMDETVDKVINSVRNDQKMFLSTPNLNFVIEAQKNELFRKSVIHSDLSIADGMPVVFMCKLLGIPIKERVAGSSLVEELIDNDQLKENPIKVYFFGGDDGIAEKAHTKLNAMEGGLVSVGFQNPGFGSIDDMSSDDIIDEINNAQPDFIIVSLGAAKGQKWIERNRQNLNANVISHLGAVINFIAGTVNRAPHWVQKLHMEWVWRIKEEPGLFGRYWNDGLKFIGALFRYILPLRWMIKSDAPQSTPIINVDWDRNLLILKGNINSVSLDDLNAVFKKITEDRVDFTLDLNGVTFIDQAVFGHLLNFWERMSDADCNIKIMGQNHSVTRMFKLNKLGYLLTEV